MTHRHELHGGNVGWRGWAGWSGVKEGKWDNGNSIINKYILKNQYQKREIKISLNIPIYG